MSSSFECFMFPLEKQHMGVISTESKVMCPSQQEMINSTEYEEDTSASPYSELIITPKRKAKILALTSSVVLIFRF